MEPSGEIQTKLKFTGMSTAGCSSTMHSSVGDEPDRIGLRALDIRSMFGRVTAENQCQLGIILPWSLMQ